MKIIIGAGNTRFDGWKSTQINELNVIHKYDFETILQGEKAEAYLAEHVWEHLTLEEGIVAAKNCYEHLLPGGYIRVAVPDANFRNEWYRGIVKIGSNGDPNHPA